jgi:peptide/nickel transport system substrate-binding protein
VGDCDRAGRRLTRRQLVGGTVAGAALIAAGPACDFGGDDDETRTAAADAKPKKGGILSVALASGGSSDSLDPQRSFGNWVDIARNRNLYDDLVRADRRGMPELHLAESLEASDSGRTWTIRLREGVEFHNGKTIDADDVIFSIRRGSVTDASTRPSWVALDTKSLKKLDARTVRLSLTQPLNIFPQLISEIFGSVVLPVGFDPKKPVGSGPFKFQSFTPGERSVFVRNPNWWNGEAHIDELAILNLTDADARLNALLSGQIQAAETLTPTQVTRAEAAGHRITETESGVYYPFVMNSNTEPFKDPRVRQAFRLLVDREQMVQQVLGGQGRVANDVYAPFDPCFDSSLTRSRDVEGARELLAEAGKSNLEVELLTTPVQAGIVEMSNILAQQAKDAGVKVNVKNVDVNTWLGGYGKWPFSVTYWGTGPGNFPYQTLGHEFTGAAYNDSNFKDEEFEEVVRRAFRESTEDGRCGHLAEAQKIYFDRGGYIIWGFTNFTDAYTQEVGGVPEERDVSYPLDGFHFEDVFLGA